MGVGSLVGSRITVGGGCDDHGLGGGRWRCGVHPRSRFWGTAGTRAKAPSVGQLRSKEVTPAKMERLVVSALRQFELDIGAGALIIVDPQKTRARILPLGSAGPSAKL